MRISDWSSDVCSSDLIGNRAVRHFDGRMHRRVREGSRGAVRYLSLEGESRLGLAGRGEDERARPAIFFEDFAEPSKGPRSEDVASGVHHIIKEIGRASWRGRVCQYVEI